MIEDVEEAFLIGGAASPLFGILALAAPGIPPGLIAVGIWLTVGPKTKPKPYGTTEWTVVFLVNRDLERQRDVTGARSASPRWRSSSRRRPVASVKR
jgi:hypothetical protein